MVKIKRSKLVIFKLPLSFNVNIIDNNRLCNTFTLRNEEGLSFVEESQDRMKLRTIEMAKLDVNKPLKDMNEQEKMIYYFLNCHKGMDDSKIKVMIEKDGVIQMLEKRVETISDDGWKKIIEDFQKLHENEERMELQFEIEEAHKQVEEANKRAEESNKRAEDADRQIEQMNQVMKQGIQAMLTNGMSLELISKSLSKSEDEIMELLK